MTVNERINLRAHFAKRGAIRPGKFRESTAVFLAYFCTGRSANALSKSPYQLARRHVGV